jgi:hypothetical protein
MSGRMSLGSLFVLVMLTPSLCLAQGGYGYDPNGAPPSGYFAPPPGQPGAQCPPGAMPPSGNRTIYEELPDDTGWLHEDSPLGKALQDRFRHAFFRTEYLLWSVGDPGHTLLSESLPTDPTFPPTPTDPRIPFNVVDPVTGTAGTAVAPTLDAVKITNNNGFRGTFGMPFGPGAFEAGAFVLANSTAGFDGSSFITPGDPVGPPIVAPTFIGQPVLQEGVPVIGSVLLYQNSYEAVLKTGVWGSEANYIFAPPNAGSGDFITFSPMFGVRYLNFRETLRQHGSYQFVTDPTTLPPTTIDVDRRIDASAINNSYGPQIGLRAELNAARLTIGVEPKIMLGLNTYKVALATENILSPTEPALSLRDSDTTFGPLADLKVYSRFALRENFHFFASYNFLWAGMLTRPHSNIVYNTSVITGAGAFQQNVHYTDAILQGLSVGAELRY